MLGETQPWGGSGRRGGLMASRFCTRCAAPLPGPPPVRCTACGYALYLNAKPSAGVVIVDTGGRFLAGRRAHHPQYGDWGLPAGFCDGWEHPADAAVREVAEELGVAIELGPLVGLYLGAYHFQDEVLPFLVAYYLARLADPDAVPAPDPAEVSETAWFRLDDPPPLAFAAMADAVRDAAVLLDTGSWPGAVTSA
ncbi:MAG: NUDIX domain-containing protein [Micromonosporaceae bacterium]